MVSNSHSVLYVGEFCHNFDTNNRLTIPAKWRASEEPQMSYLALPNPIGCITVYPPKMVAKLDLKVSEVSLGNQKGQKALTRLFSKADQFLTDKQGRINLGEKLMEHAGLRKEVIFVGNFVTFSIWDPKRYAGYLEHEVEETDEMSEILKQLGV